MKNVKQTFKERQNPPTIERRKNYVLLCRN